MRRAMVLVFTFVLFPVFVSAQDSPPHRTATQPSSAERDAVATRAHELYTEGKLAEAISAGEKLLELERQMFGDAHAELAGTLEWLSQRYLGRQDLKRAQSHAAELLRVRRALHGEDEWQTVSARWYLDYVQKLSLAQPDTLEKMLAIEAEFNQLNATEKYAEAAAKIQELVLLEEKTLGAEHPFFANTFANQAECLLNAEQFAAAEILAERALTIRKKQLGVKHPDTADAAWFLALSRIRQEKHAQALEPLELSRDVSRAAGQEADAAWMDSWRGESLVALDRSNDARSAYQSALAAFRKLADSEGITHCLVQFGEAENTLGLQLFERKQYKEAATRFELASHYFDDADNDANALQARINQADAERKEGDIGEMNATLMKAAASLDHLGAAALDGDNVGPLLDSVQQCLHSQFTNPETMPSALTIYEAFRGVFHPKHTDTAMDADLKVFKSLAVPTTKEQADAKSEFAEKMIARLVSVSPESAPLLRKRWGETLLKDATSGFRSADAALKTLDQACTEFKQFSPKATEDNRKEYYQTWGHAIFHAAAASEMIQPLSGVKRLDTNREFLRQNLPKELHWTVQKRRANWLSAAGQNREAAKGLYQVVAEMESANATGSMSYKGAIAGFVLAAQQVDGDEKLFALEIAVRRRVVDVHRRDGQPVLAASEVISMMRRLYAAQKLDQLKTLGEEAVGYLAKVNTETLATDGLVQVIGVWNALAGEQEAENRLAPSRFTRAAAWKISRQLTCDGAAAIQIGIADALHEINAGLGRDDDALTWRHRVADLSAPFLEFLLRLPESQTILSDVSGQSIAMSAVLNVDVLVSEVLEPDGSSAYLKAKRLSLLLDRIADAALEREVVDLVSTTRQARMLLWSELWRRQIGEPTGTVFSESVGQEVASLREQAISDFQSNPLQDGLSLLTHFVSLVHEAQALAAKERTEDEETRFFTVLTEISKVSDKLLAIPEVRRRPDMSRLLSVSAFGLFAAQDFEKALPLIEASCVAFEESITRTAGQPNEVMEYSRRSRHDLDPFAFGQIVANLDKRPDRALEFAIRGRGLGSRIGFERSGLMDGTKDRPRPVWASSSVADSLALQFAILDSQQVSTTDDQAKLPSIAEISARLRDDERYLFIATRTGRLGNDLTDDGVELYLVRPDSGKGELLSYFSLARDASRVPEGHPEMGVFVVDVVEGSTAAKMGIRPYDVILAYDGAPASPDTFADRVRATAENEGLDITVWREGNRLQLRRERPSKRLGVRFSQSAVEDAYLREISTSPVELASMRTLLVRQMAARRWLVRSVREAERGLDPVDTDQPEDVNSRGSSYRLFRRLIPTAVWQELRACRRIYVSLPGQLIGLPLEALVVESPDLSKPETQLVHWLDVGPEIVYLPTGRLQPKKASGDRPLLKYDYVGVGGVDFRKSTTRPRAALPGTATEVKNIAATFDPSKTLMLLGTHANEMRVAEASGSTRFLLIATHGDAKFGNDVLQSALLLSAADDTDGRLTLEELLTDWRGHLIGTEATILSACRSNSGLVAEDDGSFGLPFGFLAAGSQAVIASQWPVDDDATSLLFQAMFRHVQSGDDILTAFTKSRKSLRISHPNPKYWAPFIYISPH